MTGVLLSGLFAALVAIGTTVAIERWGGRAGGLIGTMPSTIVPASIGIASTGGTGDTLFLAMCAVAPGMLLSASFLYMWRVIPPRLPHTSLWLRLLMAAGLSLTVWVTGAVAVVVGLRELRGDTVATGVSAAICLALMVGIGVAACRSGGSAPGGKKPVSIAVLCGRGLLAGVAISTAVWLGTLGHPLVAGVAAVFPAIFLTTMVALWWSQGEAVQAGAVGPMMLGASAVASYAVFAGFLMPWLGIAAGAACAWFAAVLTTTVPSWWWLSRR